MNKQVIVPAIKRCDALLIGALKNVNNDNLSAAVSDLKATMNQLTAIIDLLTQKTQ